MKTIFLILSVLSLSSSLWASEPNLLPELSVYAYDSFAASGGLGPAITPSFEKKCGCKLRLLASGDGGQLVNRLELDSKRGKFAAQVAVGLDQLTWERAKVFVEVSDHWMPAEAEKISRPFWIAPGFVPFDYGVYAFMADTVALKKAGVALPVRLSDLLLPSLRRKIILEDPRTSTPGLAFLLFTEKVTKFDTFWDQLRTQWLTLAPGWDGAYGLFLKEEAPLVWSYTTSQAYHREHGDHSGRFRALIFEEGSPTQIEGAALIHDSSMSDSQKKLGRQFLSFLISDEVQSQVAKTNWMLPVRTMVILPQSFRDLPQPKKTISMSVRAGEVSQVLDRWTKITSSMSP